MYAGVSVLEADNGTSWQSFVWPDEHDHTICVFERAGTIKLIEIGINSIIFHSERKGHRTSMPYL